MNTQHVILPAELSRDIKRAMLRAYMDTHGYGDAWIEAVYRAIVHQAPASAVPEATITSIKYLAGEMVLSFDEEVPQHFESGGRVQLVAGPQAGAEGK